MPFSIANCNKLPEGTSHFFTSKKIHGDDLMGKHPTKWWEFPARHVWNMHHEITELLQDGAPGNERDPVQLPNRKAAEKKLWFMVDRTK